MKIQIKKSGNSASLRIPSDVLKSLNLSIGESLSMHTTADGLYFKKIDAPREGWFDNISTVAAIDETKNLENDFGQIHNTALDDWELGEEW